MTDLNVGVYFPQTVAETAAGIPAGQITRPWYPPGHIMRYGADPTGVASSSQAFQDAISQYWYGGSIIDARVLGTFQITIQVNAVPPAFTGSQYTPGIQIMFPGPGLVIDTSVAGGYWLKIDTAERTITDAVITGGSNVLTSASAQFTPQDVGTGIYGNANIPARATISGYVSATEVTMSAYATGSGGAQTVTIGDFKFQQNVRLWGGFKIISSAGTLTASGIMLHRAHNVYIDMPWIYGLKKDAVYMPCINGDGDACVEVVFNLPRFENCAGWGLNNDSVGHNETSFITMIGLTVQGCGTQMNPVASPTNPPTSGGIKWKGQIASFLGGGATLNYNCNIFIPGGPGLANSFKAFGFDCENGVSGVDVLVQGIDGFEMEMPQLSHNASHVGNNGWIFDGTTSLIRSARIRKPVIRVTQESNEFQMVKALGTNADLNSIRIEDPIYENYDYAGQIRYNGLLFEPVIGQCEFSVVAQNIGRLQAVGFGNKMPVKRANYNNDSSAINTTTTGTFTIAAVGATRVVPLTSATGVTVKSLMQVSDGTRILVGSVNNINGLNATVTTVNIVAGRAGQTTGNGAIVQVGCVPRASGGAWQMMDIGASLSLANSGLKLNIAGDGLISGGALSLANSTVYFVYLWDNNAGNGGNLQLEYSTVTPIVEVASGVKVKSMDSTRTLVGQFKTDAGGNIVTTALQSRSYYMRRGSMASNALQVVTDTPNTGLSGSELDAVNGRVNALMWDDETAEVRVNGTCSNQTAGQGCITGIGVDSLIPIDRISQGVDAVGSTTGTNIPLSLSATVSGLANGSHFFTILGAITGGGHGKWLGAASPPLRTTIEVTVIQCTI